MPGNFRSGVAAIIFLSLLLQLFAAEMEQGFRSPVTMQYLARRKEHQRALARDRQAFHDFQFTNRLAQSGITFEHRIVDDAGKNYQAAHYDHGNGVAVADVDNDGWLDIYFTSQLGQNELWRNLGNGQFENITARAGVALDNQISVGAAFADVDNDGAADLFVTTVRHGNHLFKNRGGGRFEDVTKDAGLTYSGHSSGSLFFDFDADGWLDLFVANVGVYTTDQKGPGGYYLAFTNAFFGHLFPERVEYKVLYRNLGHGRFKDVSAETGLRDGSWAGDAAVTDLNQDGFPDLYLPNMQGDDHFYENQAGKSFVEKTQGYFPKTPWGAMGAQFFDYNHDGLPDLLVTDMHSDMTQKQTEDALAFRPDIEKRKSEAYCMSQWTEEYLQGASNNIFGNAFYENRGSARFIESSDRLGVETYWPWGPSIGDLNADGFEDIFIPSGMGYPFRYAVNSVLLNEGGKRFFDSEFLLGIEPRAGGQLGKIWFTLDCSGSDRNHALCAGKRGIVSVPGSFSSRSSAILDVDNDGDLDLVTLDFNGHPQLFVSNLSERRKVHRLSLQLEGTRSNRDGLGSWVTVRVGTNSLVQYHHGKSGYLAQSSIPLYFGLGTRDHADSIEIRWPSGAKQVLGRTPAGTRRIVEHPDPLKPK